MKFDFNKNLIDLNSTVCTIDGQPVLMNILLANNIASSNRGNPVKLYGWAKDLHEQGIVNLDRPDQKILIEWIEGEQNFTNMTKYQLLEILDQRND